MPVNVGFLQAAKSVCSSSYGFFDFRCSTFVCWSYCVQPDETFGVVGLGGLGHVAVKFAKAFGAKVTVISTSPAKQQEAIERLGADSFLISKNPGQMQAAMGTIDGIIDTVSAHHPLLPLLGLLKSNGKLVMVGLPDKPFELPVFPLIMGRKIIAGSFIGGMKVTQEMIDFAAKHNITAEFISIYAVSITICIVLGFMLLALLWKFDFPPRGKNCYERCLGPNSLKQMKRRGTLCMARRIKTMGQTYCTLRSKA